MSGSDKMNSEIRPEIDKLKSHLVKQLDDYPARICFSALLELTLTFLFAAIPLKNQETFWISAYREHLGVPVAEDSEQTTIH